MHTHLADSFQRNSRSIPRFHPAGQITREFRIARAHEQLHRPLKIIVVLKHQENRLIQIEHPPRPDRENRRAANVQGARDVAAAKCKHHSRIDENARLLVDRTLEYFRRQSGNAWKIAENFRSLSIHPFHDGIIMRDWGRGFDCEVSETLRISELQKFIEFPLVTDGAARARANVRAARRARPVVRINHHVVGHFEIKIAQSMKLLFGQLFCVFVAEQIRTPSG